MRFATAARGMLRIEGTKARHGLVLALAGDVAGPWVGELARVAETALGSGASLSLDLLHVSFVDLAGVTLLNRLADRRVVLVNCSAFVTELLKARA